MEKKAKGQNKKECYNGEECVYIPNCKRFHPPEHFEKYLDNQDQLEESKESSENQYQKEINTMVQAIKNKKYTNIRIGIDFGNVICGSDPYAPKDPNEDTMFGVNYLGTPMIEGAFDVIKFLIEKFGKENIFIVSKCGENVQKKSMHWMENKQFAEETGFDLQNRLFCRERKEKATICEKNNINFFIDDRQDVLKHLDKSITKFLFPSLGKGVQKSKEWFNVVNWKQIQEVFANLDQN